MLARPLARRREPWHAAGSHARPGAAWLPWAMHRPALFRRYHAVHHASRPPTAWAAMSFHWGEALSGAIVIPLLVFVIPIHVGALGLVLTVMTVMGVTNHMGWEIFPAWMWRGPLGAWLITASHHQRHHVERHTNASHSSHHPTRSVLTFFHNLDSLINLLFSATFSFSFLAELLFIETKCGSKRLNSTDSTSSGRTEEHEYCASLFTPTTNLLEVG